MMKKRDADQKTENGKRKIGNRHFGEGLAAFVRFSPAALRHGSLILIFALSAFAQDLPGEIRGYKVHKAPIVISDKIETGRKKDNSEAFVKINEPELVETSLTGLTFEISAEIDALEQSGKVDFLTFKDFKVNGLEIEIEEYKESFEFKKNQLVSLPKPVKIFLGSQQALKGALGEINDPQRDWTVTGTVFVFGRFKKFGFDFKRVVPVEVNVKIKNPLRPEKISFGIIPSI